MRYVGTPEPVADRTKDVEFGTAYSVDSPAVTGYTPDLSVVSGTMPAEDVVITVTYTINKYAITWKNEDGTVLSTDQVEHGTVPVYSGAEPTKASTQEVLYLFSHWSPEPVAAIADAIYTASYKEAAHEYTVTFDPVSVSVKNGGATVGNGDRVKYGTVLDIVPVAKIGYTGTISSSVGTVVDGKHKVVADVAFSCEYTVNKYTVIIAGEGISVSNGGIAVANGDKVEYGTVLAVSLAEKDGHTGSVEVSVGSVIDGKYTVPDSDVTFTGKYTVNTYRLTVVYVGAPEPVAAHVKDMEFGAVYSVDSPSVAGYTPDLMTVAGTMPAKDLEVTVTYTINKYTVKYTVDGVQVGDVETYDFGTKVTVRPIFEKVGYTVSSWSCESVTITDGTFLLGAADVVLAATTTINKYTVKYTVDGSQVGDVETYDFGTKVTVRPIFEKVGYTVSPWSCESVTLTDGTFLLGAADVVLAAGSTINSYTLNITYSGAPDEIGTYSETVVYGSEYSVISPVIVGYTSDPAVVTGTMPADNLEITVTYTINRYVISWTNEDGTPLGTDETVYGMAPVFSGDVPTKTATEQYSYLFVGWSPEIVSATSDATYVAVYDRYVRVFLEDSLFTASVSDTVARIHSDSIASLKDRASAEVGTTFSITVGGSTLVFDSAALQALQVAETEVGATQLSAEQLDEAYRTILGDNVAYSVVFGGNTDFNGGKITISIPYSLTEGRDAGNLKVWYLSDGQKAGEHPCTYENGMVTFETDHLSTYAVVYEERSHSSSSNTALIVAVAVVIVILAIAGGYYFFVYRRNAV